MRNRNQAPTIESDTTKRLGVMERFRRSRGTKTGLAVIAAAAIAAGCGNGSETGPSPEKDKKSIPAVEIAENILGQMEDAGPLEYPDSNTTAIATIPTGENGNHVTYELEFESAEETALDAPAGYSEEDFAGTLSVVAYEETPTEEVVKGAGVALAINNENPIAKNFDGTGATQITPGEVEKALDRAAADSMKVAAAEVVGENDVTQVGFKTDPEGKKFGWDTADQYYTDPVSPDEEKQIYEKVTAMIDSLENQPSEAEQAPGETLQETFNEKSKVAALDIVKKLENMHANPEDITYPGANSGDLVFSNTEPYRPGDDLDTIPKGVPIVEIEYYHSGKSQSYHLPGEVKKMDTWLTVGFGVQPSEDNPKNQSLLLAFSSEGGHVPSIESMSDVKRALKEEKLIVRGVSAVNGEETIDLVNYDGGAIESLDKDGNPIPFKKTEVQQFNKVSQEITENIGQLELLDKKK